jgi:hypothetical protein
MAQVSAHHAAGLVINASAYNNAPRMAQKGGSRAVITTPVVSLIKYMPYVANQGDCQSCVGWATCYAALTASWAMKYNETSRDVITGQAFSPGWVYAQIATGCTQGADLINALEILKNAGDCRKYDFSQPLFNYEMVTKFKSKAYPFRIKDYVALFSDTSQSEDRIEQTKLSLVHQKPVIIAAIIDDNFNNLNASDNIWKPGDATMPKYGHAMCVVGYSDFDNTFTVMNSWGREWGKDGFGRITYKDYARAVKYGFQITLDDRKDPASDPVVVKGDFRLEKVTGIDTATLKITSTVPMVPTLNAGIYELNHGVHQNDIFRVLAKNISKDCYVYVFSIDPVNRAEVLFPFSKNSDLAQQYQLGATIVEVPRVYTTEEIEIPGHQKGFQTDVKGTDYMCILFSYNQISNIEQIAATVKDNNSGNFLDRLKSALGDRLISSQNLTYKFDSMSVTGSSQKGDVVPIILKTNVD